VIRSFRHKGVERFFLKGMKAGIQAAQAAKLARQLQRLDVARRPQDMNVPGWRLHPLKGDQKGHWSVWVSGNWRLTFKFEGEDAVERLPVEAEAPVAAPEDVLVGELGWCREDVVEEAHREGGSRSQYHKSPIRDRSNRPPSSGNRAIRSRRSKEV